MPYEVTVIDADVDEGEGSRVVVPRGATEGPLASLTPIFIDVETHVTKEINLSSMTLRQYLARSYLETIAIAIGEEDAIQVFFTEECQNRPTDAEMVDDTLIAALHNVARDPNYVFVCHNAAFDIRVLRFLLDMPQPINVWCTLEGAMGAWPELPGGFGLKSLSTALDLPKHLRKYDLDLRQLETARRKAPVPLKDLSEEFQKQIRKIVKDNKIGYGPKAVTTHEIVPIEVLNKILAIYNGRDVAAMREIYYRQAARLPAVEQEVAMRTHRQRQFWFEVEPERLHALVDTLDQNAQYAEQLAAEYVGDEDLRQIFNRENDKESLTSVRYQRLRNIINDKVAEDGEVFESTSLKKISPTLLARNPNVSALLQQTTRVGKMLSHRRRSAVFFNVDVVDVELGFMRAHTGRFSSPSTGRGLNLHNIPKHDKQIAEPIRKIFRLPKNMCLVRADLANVEYRIEGYLTKCSTVQKMFDAALGGNVFNDPYCLAWQAMTSMIIDKKMPIRQVAKAAVLGLGFCMSAMGYTRVLLNVLADKKSGVTEAVLKQVIRDNRWSMPNSLMVDRIVEEFGCSHTVALAAYHIHRAFNKSHPEFGETAEWLVTAVNSVASCGGGKGSRDLAQRALDIAYSHTAAPDRDLIGLEIDTDEQPTYPSVRVRCGPWPATVCWREPQVRNLKFENRFGKVEGLTIRKANGYYKPFIKQLAIENITQAAARNALCMGVAELDRMGFPYCVHVHDEVMLLVPRERESVLAARDALLKVFGPGHALPYGWSILVKPDEVTVTESMYEDEDDVRPDKGDRWGRIERNDVGCLENLP